MNLVGLNVSDVSQHQQQMDTQTPKQTGGPRAVPVLTPETRGIGL